LREALLLGGLNPAHWIQSSCRATLTLKIETSPQIHVRTLLVDDFPPFRRFLCSTLQQRPQIHIIGESGDGIEAVEMARELQPDLILLDISLPQINGLDAARRIRIVSPNSKVLFVTLNGETGVMQKAFEAGASGYIIKTDAPRELFLAIDTVVQGERFVGARLAAFDSPEASWEARIEPD
jgi:DNA-binding NarL/FixJ family response regulator